jgi:hypothetical protein
LALAVSKSPRATFTGAVLEGDVDVISLAASFVKFNLDYTRKEADFFI